MVVADVFNELGYTVLQAGNGADALTLAALTRGFGAAFGTKSRSSCSPGVEQDADGRMEPPWRR